jgi:hypothetical protein
MEIVRCLRRSGVYAIHASPMKAFLPTLLLFACAVPAFAVDFRRDVRPILASRCYDCHADQKPKGGLRLTSRENALKGGKSERPAFTPGQGATSEMIVRLTSPDHEEQMPPKGERLNAREIATLKRWIDEGAPWPDNVKHWAYEPPTRASAPQIQSALPGGAGYSDWSANPIDAFVLTRLADEQLSPSREAEPETIVRRMTLDLTGLPPAPAEVDEFVRAWRADASSAIGKLADRLLASPQFGVRWARPWLDLARYADSHGFQRDDLRDLWLYRDWVVRALNADMPFDRFTIEQLAGDLLPNATEDQLIATGFNRGTPCNVEAGTEPEENRVNQVFDRVNTLGSVWLGSTIECAQCHDHKFDPFTRRDYYQLFAFFNSTALEADRANPKTPGSIKFIGPYHELKDPAKEAARTKLEEERTKLKAQMTAREAELAKDAAAWETERAAGKPLGADLAEILALPREQRTTAQAKKLADYRASLDPTYATLSKELRNLDQQLGQVKKVQSLVMQELPEPRPSAMFNRGVYTDRGEPVQPGTPAILQTGAAPAPRTRLDLARWLVSRDNPLVARVVVNRWWAEIFGRGLVGTPEDFGIKGEAPTHPELLDWLAVEFMDSGWSMKAVLRLIVTSATYRQSSRMTPELLARDDQNKLLARGPRIRLEAEAIRDNALAIAGLLSLKQGGPPIRPPQPDGLWDKVGGEKYDYVVSAGEEKFRRGLYVVLKRGSPYPSFVNFDAGARMACTVKRSRSNTPLQALTLLNDPVYVEAAGAFAKRIVAEQPEGNAASRLRHAFRLALAREPKAGELRTLQSLYESECAASCEAAAWNAVATTLLNLDETITKS